ncbi:MAG: hypothetical protein GY820_19155 [Gammaproteobacteria bacterium]|nr:hypothetical protein [Gammaproteobacteria bacterium]
MFVAIGVFYFLKSVETGIAIIALLFSAFGVYVVMASIIPYKKTTEEIGDEVFYRVLIELPIRLIFRIIGKADHLL